MSESIGKSVVSQCADDLIGTQKSIYEWTEAHNLKIDDSELEFVLADYIERCSECDTWCEPGELVDEDGETAPCDSCKQNS